MEFIFNLFGFFAQVIGTIILITLFFIIYIVYKVKKDTERIQKEFQKTASEENTVSSVIITNKNMNKNPNREVIDYVEEE